MKDLTAEQIETLRDLKSVWPDGRLVLIGATALGCFFDMKWRHTHDLDLSVSIALQNYPGSLRGRTGWSQVQSREHSWNSPREVRVDILPVGPNELAQGKIVWPGSSAVMNLTGFRLVYELAAKIQPASDFTVEVAPPEVIALLKMGAYLDRPMERVRDLEDLSYLIEEFVPDFAEERFSRELLDMGTAYELVSAYLLGKRLAKIMNEDERHLVMLFCSRVEDENDADHTQARMARAGPWRGNPDALLSRIATLKNGLEAGSHG